jgi:AcrR family transcriptional regulator
MTAPSMATGKVRRAELQRVRILAAAKQCFIERGFHAASMANIAETAGMSPGLIYRYVENKSAVVLAIIEEQLQKVREDIAVLDSDCDLSERTIARVNQWRDGDPGIMNPALFLEMSAEGTRDASIGAAIRASDRQTRAAVIAWMCRPKATGGLGLDREAAVARALLMQCIMEGLAVRTVREPDLDRNEVDRVVRLFFDCLLAPTR